MASAKTLARIERLVWVLIYGGLLVAILGIASLSENTLAAWPLVVIGALAAIAGVVLIWVRSRLTQDG